MQGGGGSGLFLWGGGLPSSFFLGPRPGLTLILGQCSGLTPKNQVIVIIRKIASETEDPVFSKLRRWK